MTMKSGLLQFDGVLNFKKNRPQIEYLVYSKHISVSFINSNNEMGSTWLPLGTPERTDISLEETPLKLTAWTTQCQILGT